MPRQRYGLFFLRLSCGRDCIPHPTMNFEKRGNVLPDNQTHGLGTTNVGY